MRTIPTEIASYLRQYANELGDKVVQSFPPLHAPTDATPDVLTRLKRNPFPAQALAIAGIVKRWESARAAAAVAECGTGKTLISLGSVFASANGRPFTALALVPPILVEKWARETLQTLPGVRVFVIDGVRNKAGSNGHTGVNEVRIRHGRIVREGIQTTLTDMRLAKGQRSARARWMAETGTSSLLIVSRETAKLSYAWRHAFAMPESGPFRGNVVNPDTGRPVILGDDQVRRADLRKAKLSEFVSPDSEKDRKPFFSPLWQADRNKVRRMAVAEFVGRYMRGFFDYFIADEVHELKSGETAQGNALGTLASACGRTVVLTGTLLGGYADELFHLLFRTNPQLMREDGFEYGESGMRQFAEAYGVLEKITTTEPEDNASSKGRTSVVIKRRPGASPMIFGKYLMDMAAFVSLEDISEVLPPYTEDVISVPMDATLDRAYRQLEDDVKQAIRDHPGNTSVISTAMNALLLYPDRPFGLGTLHGYKTNDDGLRERFTISEPADLNENVVYAKERRLIEECQRDVAAGRGVQIFAVYTRTRDVTRRLQTLLEGAGLRSEVLTAEVPPERREAWYERRLRAGMQVCIAHPKLCCVGLDLLHAKSLYFVQTGYSTYVLRQASRRSWRIGQKDPIRVGYFVYADTAQESCLRLMGKKLLVSLAMEGKLEGGGLESIDGDNDVLTAMARELVTKGVGESAASVWKGLRQHLPTKPIVELVVPQAEPVIQPDSDLWVPRARFTEQLSLF